MGLFSKARKPVPKITVNGIEISYDGWWEFTYRDQAFMRFEPHLHMPSREELDVILSNVAALKPEMTERIAKCFRETEEIKMNDGESFYITLKSEPGEPTYEVAWSGGASWGDLGVTFTITDRRIVAEDWDD